MKATITVCCLGSLALACIVGRSSAFGQEKGQPNQQMQAVLDELAALEPKPLTKLDPAEARQQPTPGDAVMALLKKQGKSTDPEPVGKVVDISIPSDAGKIPARIYTPKGDGPFPVLVYWHGGGWVIADLDTYDSSCRALTNAAQCIVVSCHYRQAPEHPFPAATIDAMTAYKWVLKNTAEFNGDPQRIAVGGESAGGNLAAVTALRARTEKVTMPVHQLLVYPVTNHAFDTESYKQFADAKPLNQEMMKWFWGHYLSKPEDAGSAYASVWRTKDLSNLPPATIITAEIDPLRSEGAAYAKSLQDAGVAVDYIDYKGVTHEFFGMGAVVDEAKQAVAKAAAGLKTAFKN